LRSSSIQAGILIPLDKFSPLFSTISFWVEVPTFVLSETLPKWDTHWVQENSEQSIFCRGSLLRLEGSYRYYALVIPGNLEQLKLDIAVSLYFSQTTNY
jgi:hypothetical protein